MLHPWPRGWLGNAMLCLCYPTGSVTGPLDLLLAQIQSLAPSKPCPLSWAHRKDLNCQAVQRHCPLEAEGHDRDQQCRDLHMGTQMPYCPRNLGNISLVLRTLLPFPLRHMPGTPQTVTGLPKNRKPREQARCYVCAGAQETLGSSLGSSAPWDKLAIGIQFHSIQL